MGMLDRRVEVLLGRERYRRVREAARREGRSLASVILDAIDAAYPSPPSDRAAAAREVLEAEPMPVPEPEELRAELEALRAQPSIRSGSASGLTNADS
ncbi:MAG: antitoxin [Chloroflexi bacterium]|nr:antitoxin [Chloroflexota bacterium]